MVQIAANSAQAALAQAQAAQLQGAQVASQSSDNESTSKTAWGLAVRLALLWAIVLCTLWFCDTLSQRFVRCRWRR